MTECKGFWLALGRLCAGACLAATVLGVPLFAGAEAASLSVPDQYLPELVEIPAGEMAVSDPDRRSSRTDGVEPRRVVFERPFQIGRFEITFEQWDYCHQAGACAHRPHDKGWGRADRPVIDVSWDDIAEYLDWLSAATGARYRLPTQDEWEYAARAGSPEPVEPAPYFDDEDVAWAEDFLLAFRGTAKTQPVRSYESNAFGVVGTRGNVWEWTDSCWRQTYVTDDGPVSRENCGIRILRGEHTSHMPTFVRNTSTGGCSVRPMPANFGFRVLRES